MRRALLPYGGILHVSTDLVHTSAIMEPHDPAVTKGTNYVRVSVADTSTGIDEAIKRESREMLGITDPMAEFLGVTIGPARP